MRRSRSFKARAGAGLLATTLLFIQTGSSGAQTFHGLLVYGHEVHTLQPCGGAQTFWVQAPDIGHELATTYQRLATRPYEPVYAELEGTVAALPVTGFGADYNGTLAIHAITSVSREQVMACRNGKR